MYQQFAQFINCCALCGFKSRLLTCSEKLDIRSRPHPLLGDRQLNPSYRGMAMECGLSFFIRTTQAHFESIYQSGVLRGLKQYKFHLCCIYIRAKLYFELFVFFEKSARPNEKTYLEMCTQETVVFGSV